MSEKEKKEDDKKQKPKQGESKAITIVTDNPEKKDFKDSGVEGTKAVADKGCVTGEDALKILREKGYKI